MQKLFVQTINEMRGLINEWSALSDNMPHNMLRPRFLLAVSGGIDSMCMADLFSSVFSPDDFALAHCNFNLRGSESDGDEDMVKRWASERGVEIHSMSFDTKAFAKAHSVSIEMAARELRYRWFAELCKTYNYSAVSVAHNANDNAETLILNLLRGSGMNGLSGMSPVSGLPYSDTSTIRLIRPLLSFTRKQIEGYVYSNKVPYREDSTNALSDYKRNRIRNEVFPIFEKINPSSVRTINREMGYFCEAAEIVSDYCARAVDGLVRKTMDGKTHVALNQLMQQKHWRYLLYHILEPYGFNSSVLASVEALLSSDRTMSGKRFSSDSHLLMVGRDELTLAPAALIHNTEIMTVRAPGTYHYNGHRLMVEEVKWETDMPLKQPDGVQIIDASVLSYPFVLRTWRAGDWFVPLGMRGKKKVSDLFTDLKYDAFMKEDAIVIVDVKDSSLAQQQRVAGLAGVRIDDRYKVSSSTQRVIRITLDPTEC